MQKINFSSTPSKRATRIRLIVFTALMTALTTVLTLVSIPLATGYYNFGDIPIFLSACLLGPIPALITGAVGAMLGDVILGYMPYAPFTLIIKALEGLVVAILFRIVKKMVKKSLPQALLCAVCNILGGLIMALGYFLAEGLLLAENSWTGGIINLPFNILQGVISAIAAVALMYVFGLKRLFEKIYQRGVNNAHNGDISNKEDLQAKDNQSNDGADDNVSSEDKL